MSLSNMIKSASFIDPTRNSASIPMMKITAFKEAKRFSKKGSLILPYDESSLDITLQNATHTPNTVREESGRIRFINACPTDLKVTFVLDDTTFSNLIGYAMPRKSIPGSVDKKIKQFQKLCYTIDSSTKEPFYLSIKSLSIPLLDNASGVFDGILGSAQIKTELVDLTGSRVKAKIICTFKHSAVPK